MDERCIVVLRRDQRRRIYCTYIEPSTVNPITTMLFQLLSLIGAAMVLFAYAANQRGRLTRDDVWYNVLNLVGSTLLTVVAVIDRRLGFILLEGLWAIFSIPPLLAARRPRS